MNTVDELCDELSLEGYSFKYLKTINDFRGKFSIKNDNGKEIIVSENMFENVYNLSSEIFYNDLKKYIKDKFEGREVGDDEMKIITPTKELIEDTINFQMPDLAKNEIELLNEYQKNINEKYLEIIYKCKFISKPDEWFVEGTEAVIEDNVIYPEYKEGDKFNSVCGLFDGLTNETFKGYDGELPRPDGETCPLDEFYIYDEFGNEISELTLDEYQKLLENK